MLPYPAASPPKLTRKLEKEGDGEEERVGKKTEEKGLRCPKEAYATDTGNL